MRSKLHHRQKYPLPHEAPWLLRSRLVSGLLWLVVFLVVCYWIFALVEWYLG